jgi:sugar phosphate isomerase/epimerase
LIEPAVRVAEKEGVTLVVETGNGTLVHSCYTARKLCEAIGSDHLMVLWDPANACYCHEVAWPDGYEEVRDHLGHLHIKDVQVDTPRAHLEVRSMGEGQLAGQFQPLADALRADGYQGVVSFESVYHPGDRDFEAGFRTCVGTFKAIFG